MRRHRHFRVQRGLTFLEVALVLAVIAIFASLAVPSFTARMERQRVQGAAEALAGDIAEARFEAARRGQPLFVEATAGASWCWAVATAPGCSCDGTQSCQLHAVRAGTQRGVKLVEGLAVRIDPAGAAQATQAALLETSRGERLRVEVSPLGRPRVCAVSGTWSNTAPC